MFKRLHLKILRDSQDSHKDIALPSVSQSVSPSLSQSVSQSVSQSLN